MLTWLHVKNLALIKEEEISFKPGLNIMTGETGAGKSIILGALSMALGQKADRDRLRDPKEDGLVEVVFSIENEEQRQALSDMEIEVFDDEVILTRRILEGRTTAKINGETVPAGKMKAVGDLFLDIYGQNEHQLLQKKAKHLELLDAYGGEVLLPLKEKVREAYTEYRKLREEFTKANLDEGERAREISFLTHEIEEIEGAKLRAGEDEELEKQYHFLLSARKIAEGLAECCGCTGEENAAGMVGRALMRMAPLTEFDEGIADMYQTLSDVESLLSGFNRFWFLTRNNLSITTIVFLGVQSAHRQSLFSW